jgi:predicted alpha/beta-fold hydrolase
LSSRVLPLTPTADDDFRPPRWLRNPHVQSVLASSFVRRARVVRYAAPVVAAQRERLLECGDGVRLQCFLSSPAHGSGAPVVLLHGWEGSAESLYVLSMAQRLFERGFEVARLNLRDHGETHHLNREIFHSCRLPEVIGAVRALQREFPGRPLQLVGFSLGGNFLLRVAARSRAAGLELAGAIAVSPVLDPHATMAALQGGMPGYQRYFVSKWVRSLRKKKAAWPAEFDFSKVERMGDLARMTAELVHYYSDFSSLDAYLDGYAITGECLATLESPTHLITSLDDPIIPVRDLPRIAAPPALRLTLTRYGGHCGFIDSLSGPTWLERRVLSWLHAADAEQAHADSQELAARDTP